MKRLIVLSLALAGVTACAPKSAAPLGPLPTTAGIAGVKALPAPYDGGDPVAGRDAFALCIGCHGFDGSGKGPSLARVFGKPAGVRADFTYSEALRTSGIVWDAKRLDQWMFDPHETLPGTSMKFIGVRNDKKRRDLVAYLAAISADPPAD